MTNEGAKFTSAGSRPLFGSPLLSGVVASVADMALVVDPTGLIQSAMAGQDSRSLEDISDWPRRNLSELVDPASLQKFRGRADEILARVAEGDRDAFFWTELVHEKEGGESFPVRYSMHWLEDQHAILMLGRDQRPVMEMQQQILNAQIALERDYEAQREMDTRYRLLMEFTSDSIAIVGMHNRRIVDLNHHAAALLGAARGDLLGADLTQQFVLDEADDLMAQLAAAAPGTGGARIDVETKRGRELVQIHARVFRAAGERLALCRFDRPGLSVAAAGPLADDLDQLFYKGVDAIVFTDKDGVVVAASDAFLNLTDSIGQEAVVGRSIADFLSRGAIDLKVLLENVRRAGHLRSYSTRLVTDFDAQISVEMSATWLSDRTDPRLALIIRDNSSVLSMRRDPMHAQDGMRGVMELVGSSPLKNIVAETTNVVERICIETAIELTRNNRVAAAEMLGLSRQSLYVKLRKYGLLSRDDD